MTEPYGEVLEYHVQWATTPVYQYNYKLKMYEYMGEQIVKDAYISNNYRRLEKGLCRCCERPITPYTQKYYQPHFDNGFKYCFMFSAENFYCEDCAKAESEKKYVNTILPRLVSTTYPVKDGEICERREYSDGSVIEELSCRELARDPALK